MSAPARPPAAAALTDVQLRGIEKELGLGRLDRGGEAQSVKVFCLADGPFATVVLRCVVSQAELAEVLPGWASVGGKTATEKFDRAARQVPPFLRTVMPWFVGPMLSTDCVMVPMSGSGRGVAAMNASTKPNATGPSDTVWAICRGTGGGRVEVFVVWEMVEGKAGEADGLGSRWGLAPVEEGFPAQGGWWFGYR